MRITIPLGREMRWSIGHTRDGWFTMRWRKPPEPLWYPDPGDEPGGGDDDGLTGVREPRKPSPSSQAGDVALPRPVDGEFR
jgi:hypothetical protein